MLSTSHDGSQHRHEALLAPHEEHLPFRSSLTRAHSELPHGQRKVRLARLFFALGAFATLTVLLRRQDSHRRTPFWDSFLLQAHSEHGGVGVGWFHCYSETRARVIVACWDETVR